MAFALALVLAAVLASPSPAPSPTPTPTAHPASARPKLLSTGPQFFAIGAAITPHVRSEFAPGSTTGLTSFEGWHTGVSTLLGRFQVMSFTDYRSFSFDHQGSVPVATVGGRGYATVAPFRVHDDEVESGGGVRVAPNLFAGLAFSKRQETSGYPALTGLAYVVLLAPDPRANVMPYGWFTYQPNTGGLYALPDGSQTALTYGGTRYRFGLLFREPGTRAFLDVGFAGEDLYDRTNAPMRVTDEMLTVGLGFHF
jgi:hypothetical protein